METLLAPLMTPVNIAVLATILVLVAAAVVLIAVGRREGRYRSERSIHVGYDGGEGGWGHGDGGYDGD
jgi:hypothetical protein